MGAVAVLVLATACSQNARSVSKNCEADIAAGYCDAAGTKCNVKVEIAACGVKPTTTPEALHVCKQNTKITWTLSATGSASGAKFASNGIDFKGNPEFENPRPGDTDFEWKDKRSKADPDHPAKYDLHLLTKDAGPCADYDPFVYNE
jgi:hypothetical protein